MVAKIGLIAEDESDIDVVKLLAKKISGKTISEAHFIGKGCGPLKRKAVAWCKSLLTKGCERILLIHDRDRNVANTLRSELEGILDDAPQRIKVVIIPEEELEAWLLSDADAIRRAFKLRKAMKEVHHPETIDSPKEYIRSEAYRISERKFQYVNSVHNKLIASEIDVSFIEAKCPSFSQFKEFFGKKK